MRFEPLLLRSLMAATFFATVLVPRASAAASSHASSFCSVVDTLVSTGPGGTAPSRIRGQLCMPERGSSAVQVLVHGATFDRTYWDPPGEPDWYSYVRAANLAGFSTFAFDRLGSGESDTPPSLAVTVDAEVEVLHQIVHQLRQGQIGSQSFQSVVSVGHSLGAIIALFEAGLDQDVDGLLMTGFSHADASAAEFAFFGALHPAALEARFSALDAGYYTTVPGSRPALFFSSLVTPALLSFDEAHKSVVTAGEFLPTAEGDPSGQVRAPVLVVAGAKDPFGCGTAGCTTGEALAQQERSAFTSAPSVDGFVVPGTGHALNFHETAPLFFAVANGWSLRHVGQAETR
jgi:pimeloyl-ACP methyl ester carboxylesterase